MISITKETITKIDKIQNLSWHENVDNKKIRRCLISLNIERISFPSSKSAS